MGYYYIPVHTKAINNIFNVVMVKIRHQLTWPKQRNKPSNKGKVAEVKRKID